MANHSVEVAMLSEGSFGGGRGFPVVKGDAVGTAGDDRRPQLHDLQEPGSDGLADVALDAGDRAYPSGMVSFRRVFVVMASSMGSIPVLLLRRRGLGTR